MKSLTVHAAAAVAGMLLCCLFLSACPAEQDDSGAVFNALVDEYVKWRFEAMPNWATSVGVHDYDHLLTDMSAEAVQARRAKEREFAARLAEIDKNGLSLQDAIDYEILAARFEREELLFNTLQAHKRKPGEYRPTGPIYDLIKRDFAPLEQRLRSAMARMDGIPALLEAAKANLDNPPRVYTEVAISQNRGAIDLFRNTLPPLAEGLDFAAEFAAKCEESAKLLEGYGKWLDEDLLPRSNGEWRVGADAYDKVFALVVETDEPPDEFLAYCENYFNEVRNEMIQIAVDNWSSYFPDKPVPSDPNETINRVMDKVAEDHSTPEGLLDDIRGDVEEIKAFIREHELLDLPDPDRLEVVRMPEFEAGFSTAYNDQPPPYEPGGKSFYAVTPFLPSWTAEQVESFLREYNRLMFKLMTVHEAYPGHFVQGWYASKLDSPVRKLFDSGVYVEGWATYCEWMMLENGYYADNPGYHLQRLKYHLRAVANSIIDQKLQKGLMSDEECVDFLVNQSFQTMAEATGKLQRAKLSVGQLCTYFYGYKEMMRLRRDYEERSGEAFNQKEYHHKVLQYGAPPMPLLRKLILP